LKINLEPPRLGTQQTGQMGQQQQQPTGQMGQQQMRPMSMYLLLIIYFESIIFS
jgi:hypothetical protein